MSSYEPPARKRLREARGKATAEREAAESAAAAGPAAPAMTDAELAELIDSVESGESPIYARHTVRLLLARVKRLQEGEVNLRGLLDHMDKQNDEDLAAMRADFEAALAEREAQRDEARARLAEIGTTREEFALRTGDGREAFCATAEGAARIAEDWNRVRSDGPWSAERRHVGQWHKVKPACPWCSRTSPSSSDCICPSHCGTHACASGSARAREVDRG